LPKLDLFRTHDSSAKGEKHLKTYSKEACPPTLTLVALSTGLVRFSQKPPILPHFILLLATVIEKKKI
jgi:hypothetical protein